MRLPGYRATLTALLMLSLGAGPARAGVDLVFTAGFEDRQGCIPAPGSTTCPGFQVQAPNLTVPAGEAITFCYYFRSANAAPIGVRRWSSTMDAAISYLIVYSAIDSNGNPVERQPPGTLSSSCGIFSGAGNPGWHHAAYGGAGELVMPADDGNGLPLAMEIAAGMPMVMQMRIVNPTDGSITASAALQAEGLPTGTAYTKTASYLTLNISISIPPNSVGFTVAQACPTPVGSKFWAFSTRTHRLGVFARVRRSGQELVNSDDWEQPRTTLLAAPNFVEFPPFNMGYECTYVNPTGVIVSFGEDELTDEQCIGIGLFFPATRPAICINSSGPL